MQSQGNIWPKRKTKGEEPAMKVNGTHFRTIWWSEAQQAVEIIDQTKLPHVFETIPLTTLDAAAMAIQDMWVRGAPLIGATAAYGIALAMRHDASDAGLAYASKTLMATRPTAVNLRWALDDMQAVLAPLSPTQRPEAALQRAAAICDEDAAICENIGNHGLSVLQNILAAKADQSVLNVLTHCNAGWLATVDWGTAIAPIYKAHAAGLPVHVWVDETRPRNQGASLTAWELRAHGIPHTVIVDNAGGHLMQHGMVDVCIVGTDRTTASGDVCNKIGTYLKALAAHDNNVPFYVALPSPTIDWTVHDGLHEIPIEQRDGTEVSHLTGKAADGSIQTIQITPDGSPCGNYAFDVTPAKYVSGLITEQGVCPASAAGLAALFPEKGAL
jgi:methylthioribose-1-phosphate isomerase